MINQSDELDIRKDFPNEHGEDKQDKNPLFQPHPIADLNLTSKVFDLLQYMLKTKRVIKGLNEVIKSVSKNEVEIVIMASNTNPLALLSPIPNLCDENSVPYIYVISAAALGRACGIKRPVVCCAIKIGEGQNEQVQINLLKDKIERLTFS